MDVSQGLVVILFIAAVIIGLAYNYYAAQKRREALFALAFELGMEFYHFDQFHIRSMYSFFDIFNKGHSQKAYNIIRGRINNFEITAFDYDYYITHYTNKGSRKQKYTFSAVIADTTAVFKPLNIRPENLQDKVAGSVGFDDIDFESDEFSRKFHVSSPDKKFAYDVVHPRMMEFLLANQGWRIHMMGRSVLIHNGSKFTPWEFRSGIRFVCDFLGQFPEYLWQQIDGARRPSDV